MRLIPDSRNLAAVSAITGVPPSDILAWRFNAHLHQPSYYVALDRAWGRVVVAIRGTLQLGDYLTILDAVPARVTLCGVEGAVHAGMHDSALRMLPAIAAALAVAGERFPGAPVVLTGHSLGGGVAALLAPMLVALKQGGDARLERVGSISSIGIGSAAAMCAPLSTAVRGLVTSVVYGADAIPMFSVHGARLLIDEMVAASQAAALLSRMAGALGLPTLQCSAQRQVREIDAAVRSSSGSADSGSDNGSTAGGFRRPSGGRSSGVSPRRRSVGDRTDVALDVEGVEGVAAAGHETVMFPPGRLLWLLPGGADAHPAAGVQKGWLAWAAGKGSGAAARHAVVDADQSTFRRFLILPSTAVHHVLDAYIDGLHSLAW